MLLHSSFGRSGAQPCRLLFDESLRHAIHNRHRISLRSSSLSLSAERKAPRCVERGRQRRSFPRPFPAKSQRTRVGKELPPTAFAPSSHFLRPIFQSFKNKDPPRANVSNWSPAASKARGRRRLRRSPARRRAAPRVGTRQVAALASPMTSHPQERNAAAHRDSFAIARFPRPCETVCPPAAWRPSAVTSLRPLPLSTARRHPAPFSSPSRIRGSYGATTAAETTPQ